MEKTWDIMSEDERQASLFKSWESPQGAKFVSEAAEQGYRQRTARIKAAIQLKTPPDRVPVFPVVGFYPAFYSKMTPRDVMYDYAKLHQAWKKCAVDLDADAHIGCFIPGSGRILELLDYRLYSWPGHGVSEKNTYQYNEGEYFKADEYDAFINDPTQYFSTAYLPRIFGALAPFHKLPNLTNILEIVFVGGNLVPYGFPDVQAAYKTLFEVGSEALKWGATLGAFNAEMTELGYPNFFGGAAKAPFDVLGDTLRGTKGIMTDIYRRPTKVLAALDAIVPMMINMGASMAKMGGNPLVFIPLHKGADGFMSDEQFQTFYWPSFKKVLLGLIAEGCVPYSFVEGHYNTRLEVIRDLPKGKVIWSFDATDMAKAKDILGDVACIGGNVSLTTLQVGTKQDVKDSVRNLIKIAGKGGGFILTNGAAIDECKPQNLKAMIDYTKEFGQY